MTIEELAQKGYYIEIFPNYMGKVCIDVRPPNTQNRYKGAGQDFATAMADLEFVLNNAPSASA
jgi:hypothetical protein